MICCRLRKTLTVFHSLLFTMLHECSVSQDVACPLPDSILIDSTCFMYTASNVTWHEAKILCEQKETLLAKVLSADHIRKILSNYSSKISIAGAAFGAWVGANDLRKEGSFHWLDDDASVVENVWASFEPNQPINVEEDCAAINSLMLLSAVECGIRNSYLCMHEAVNPVRYFKPPYNLHCHCSDGICDVNGKCSSRKCAPHWFGETCQNRNLPSNLKGLYETLDDNDDFSCYSDPSHPLYIKFGHIHYLTWIRIVLGVHDQHEDFELDFPENNGKCEHLGKIIVDRMTVDLYCYSGPTEVNSLTISWSGFKTICSIYFNGGRNLIFLNSTYHIAPGPDPNKGDYYPVDGSKARGGRCTQARVGAGPNSYVVKLGNPLLIREIILYRRVNVSGYSHMIPASISGLSNEVVKFRFEFNSSLNYPVVWHRTDIKETIDTIKVSLNSNSANRGLLDICEIETYSACPEGKYGLLCDKNCMDKCNSSRCLDDGGCLEIPFISTTTPHIPIISTTTPTVVETSGSSLAVTKTSSKSISAIDPEPPIGLTVFVNATDPPAGSGSENSPPGGTTVLNHVTDIEDKNTTGHPKNSTGPPYRFQDYKKKLLYLAWSLLAVGALCSLCVTVLCCVHRREVKQEVKAESIDIDLDFDFDDEEGSNYLGASYSRSTSTSKYGGKSLSYSMGPTVTESTRETSGTSRSYSTIFA